MGKAMLEELAAAEILPVGILHPLRDCALIAEIEGVFQIVQSDHQPHRTGGSPVIGAEQRSAGGVEL
jgi:hypothetical protein